MNQEIERLEVIAEDSIYALGVMEHAIKYCYKVFSRHMIDGNVLELGPAEGLMTELILQDNYQLTIIEGSLNFCEILKNKFPNAEIINSLFEDFSIDKKFNNIILGHVLEHVIDPVGLLKHIKNFLTPGGKILAAVPNARSIHRQAAVIMGYLQTEDSLNERDIQHDHRCVFNPESFRSIFYQSGLNIDIFGGYWLKPLSNKQIEETWTLQMIESFFQLGERYPDIAGEIYVVAS